MAINATNYDGTKDYKIAEVGDVYHPNLLINGDFQINQRGQTSYSNASLTPAYTLDMWYSIKATITKTDSGVTVSANQGQAAHLVQKIPRRNTTKTLVAKVNGKIYSTVFTGSKATIQLDSSVGSISTQYIDSTYQQVEFIINSGKTANIEYCDLFEGNIAYPHVKEDYGVAYQKCSRYFYRLGGKYNVAISTGYVASDGGIRFVLKYPVMDKLPTITLNNNIEIQGADLTTMTYIMGYPDKFKTLLIALDSCFVAGFPETAVAPNSLVSAYLSGVYSHIDVSCEPL